MPKVVDSTRAKLTRNSGGRGDEDFGGVYTSGACGENGTLRGVSKRVEGDVSSKEWGDDWCGETHEAKVTEFMRALRKSKVEKEFAQQTR